MRIVGVLILLLTAIALAVTLYNYGQVKYYWYANEEGRGGYTLTTWHGSSLDDTPGYLKGYSYRYDIYRFESNAETRTILIILILGGAMGASIGIVKRRRRTMHDKQPASPVCTPRDPQCRVTAPSVVNGGQEARKSGG